MTTERIHLFTEYCKSKPVYQFIERQFVKDGYLQIVAADDGLELADEWEIIECARQAGISFALWRRGDLIVKERADL